MIKQCLKNSLLFISLMMPIMATSHTEHELLGEKLDFHSPDFLKKLQRFSSGQVFLLVPADRNQYNQQIATLNAIEEKIRSTPPTH